MAFHIALISADTGTHKLATANCCQHSDGRIHRLKEIRTI
jgi:hypothetical protein